MRDDLDRPEPYPTMEIIRRVCDMLGLDPYRAWSGWDARCPLHTDGDDWPLVIRPGREYVQLGCDHGCDREEILRALNLQGFKVEALPWNI